MCILRLHADMVYTQYTCRAQRGHRLRAAKENNTGHATRGPQQHICMFLEWDADGADTVSWMLLRSDDVETNPGPRPGEKCENCEARFTQQTRQVQCGTA